MREASGMKTRWSPAWLFTIALACFAVGNARADADANPAALLRAEYGALQVQLSHNHFEKPLYMDSSEISGAIRSDVYAVVSYPFATAGAVLNGPAHWCDILILHLNIKYCRASTSSQGSVLNVSIGRKHDQPLEEAYQVDFAYRVAAETPNYLNVRLNAVEGPLSTRNYRIMLEAIPLEDRRTFIHLSYSYSYGLMGRLAMRAYLATGGSNKVGFTVVGKQSDGQPLHVGGMRGVVERNTMRYYLAIEAFLGALSAPPQARFEKRLHDWFAAVERYPRQLHEMEQGEYLDMKRKEYFRQRAEVRATTKPAPGA